MSLKTATLLIAIATFVLAVVTLVTLVVTVRRDDRLRRQADYEARQVQVKIEPAPTGPAP